MSRDAIDPKDLIAESYRIDGIGAEECRSIFLDWALSTELPKGHAPAVRALLERHGAAHPDHPMTVVLREAAAQPRPAGRRGGRAGRLQKG
ncbi:MAG: hypothetical protein KDA73_12195 [Rhodobacteraceae bacterium]|nr:hypothetical protein [Paracoccaceae bacterium]